MIDVQLGAIVEALPAFQRLSAVPLHPATAYRVASLLRVVRIEVLQFQAQYEALIERHGVPGQEPDTLQAGPGTPNHAAFVADVDALLRLDVELQAQPLLLTQLHDDITAADMALLMPFVIEDERSALRQKVVAPWPKS